MNKLKQENQGNAENAQGPTILENKIFSEKVDLLYKNLLISVPSSLLCATIVFLSFYLIPHSSLLINWFIAVLIISVFRLGLSIHYLFDRQPTKSRFYLFLLASILAAALWGMAGSVLMPKDQLIEQMIAIVVIAGVTAGGVQSLQASLTASLTFMSLVLLPLCAWAFLQHSISYTILGLSLTLYFLFTIVISLRGFKFLNEILRLKYNNLSLAENLSRANQALSYTNQDLIEKETNLRLIHDNAPIGMAIISLDGRWLNVNNKLCQILGYSKEELESLTLQDIIYQEDLEKDAERKEKLLAGKLPAYQMEKRYVKKDEQLIWILTNVSLVRGKEGKPLYFISQIQDINDRKQNERVIAGLNNMNEMLQLCHDSNEAYPIICQTAENLFTDLSGGLAIYNIQTKIQERVGTWGSNSLLKSKFKSADCWAFRAGHPYMIHDLNKAAICHHFESLPTGGTICLPLIVQSDVLGMLNFTASAEHSFTNYQEQIIKNFSEIAKLALANINLNEALRGQAIHDPLTGLVNRRYLSEWLPEMIHHVISTKKVLCVCMLDLDFFKRVNDVYGHDAGDEVLKFIGKLLNENLRESDIACRYGGEEFVVVLVGSNLQNTSLQMERIRTEVKNAKIIIQNQQLPSITISIGLAEVPQHGVTISDILRAADSALYTAKQSGRDKVVVFEGNLVSS